jgi:general secretion pathway protein A
MVDARATPPRTSRHPYLDWWGLVEAPFQLEPEPRFAFPRDAHQEGLARMLFGLTQLGGIVAITGDVGCGKTMLARALEQTLGTDGFTVVGVSNPPRTPSGLLAALLASADSPVRGGGAGRLAVRLRARLADEVAGGRRPVVVVDEAQRLDARALDELRMLTNSGGGPAVPVVLLGQPELGAHIRRLPQVAQRVVVRYHLGTMDRDEVSTYIQHRSRVAGATRRLFSNRAETAAHQETEGVPRLVNLLCANALFVGYARGDTQIGEDLIRDLSEDRDIERETGGAE